MPLGSLGAIESNGVVSFGLWLPWVSAADRNRYGVFGNVVDRAAAPWTSGWWRYRLPGSGEVDWPGFLGALARAGYDGVVSVEHEDPVWTGTVERVTHGLELARDVLAPLVEAPLGRPATAVREEG